MRVSHIRWSATVTKIYTKQRQKKPVRSQLRVSNELWGHEGDIVPRPAHLQPWQAPRSAHTSPASVQEITRHIAGTCQPSATRRAEDVHQERPGNGLGRGGRYCCPSLCCPLTEVDHIQGTIGNKEMLLPFRGCYNSPRCALMGLYLNIQDPGVLIIVRTEKELPLVSTKAGGSRDREQPWGGLWGTGEWKAGHDPAAWACSPGTQVHPELHQKIHISHMTASTTLPRKANWLHLHPPFSFLP